LEVVGKLTRHKMPYSKKPGLYTLVESPVHDALKHEWWYEFAKANASYGSVQGHPINVKKTIEKFDRPVIKPNNQFLDTALYYTTMMCLPMLMQAAGHTNSQIVEAAGAGLTYKKHGIPTKGEAMKSSLFLDRVRNMATPLYESVWKKELLKIIDILEDLKIRTYLNPEVDFVVVCKFFFDNQNEKFKELCKDENFFGRYGWSKEYGNFDRLITLLQEYKFIYSSDVSGWDRIMPMLKEWYELRTKYLVYPPEMKDRLEHSVLNLVESLVVDEEGLIFKMRQGNRSGQPSTTVDNTGCHIIIKFYILISLYYEKNAKIPTYRECLDNFPNLLGDDNLTGLDDNFVPIWDINMMKSYIVKYYSEFGLTVKNSAFKAQIKTVNDKVDDFEFLGCTVAWSDKWHRYYPVPRQEKFYSQILYTAKTDSIEIYAQRIVGLAYLTYGNDLLGQIIISVASHLLKDFTQFLDTPTQVHLAEVVIQYSKLAYIQFGLE